MLETFFPYYKDYDENLIFRYFINVRNNFNIKSN